MKDWCDRGQGLQSTERGSALLMRLTCAAFETGETRRGDPLNKRATHRNRRPSLLTRLSVTPGGALEAGPGLCTTQGQVEK